MFEVWDTPFILNKLIAKNKQGQNKLQHENDGLIFTMDACPYYPGTCPEILKWKPLELNSIDFSLGEEVNKNTYALYCAGDGEGK